MKQGPFRLIEKSLTESFFFKEKYGFLVCTIPVGGVDPGVCSDGSIVYSTIHTDSNVR